MSKRRYITWKWISGKSQKNGACRQLKINCIKWSPLILTQLSRKCQDVSILFFYFVVFLSRTLCQSNFLSPPSGIHGSNTNLRRKKNMHGLWAITLPLSHGWPLRTDVSKINRANLLRLNLKITYNKCDFQAQFCSSFPHDASWAKRYKHLKRIIFVSVTWNLKHRFVFWVLVKMPIVGFNTCIVKITTDPIFY